MDTFVWKVLCNAVRSADRSAPCFGRRKECSDQLIVRMYFGTVAHDRPRSFAASRANYSTVFRPKRLAQTDAPVQTAFMDGKALPISESSSDPDARSGRGHGKFSRGYTLALENGRIHAFFVRPMNEAEPRIARERLAHLVPQGRVVIADGNYDSKFIYDAVAARRSRFFAPPNKAPQQRRSWRGTSETRRAAVVFWEQQTEAARALDAQRSEIERIFSRLSGYGGGPAPLPGWVTRLDRVTRWVTAKIALYHARLIVRERNARAA